MTEIYLKVFLLQSPRYNLSFFKNKNYSLKDLKLVFVDLESLDELSKEDNNCQSVIILPSSEDFNALLSLDANSINVVAYGNLQDLKNKPIDVENTNFTGLISENITKEELDAWVLESHRRASDAQTAGVLSDIIVPVNGCERDDGIRPRMNQRLLDRLPLIFGKGSLTNAGNSCLINDGAAFVVLVSEKYLAKHKIKPAARILGTASMGGVPDESPRGAMRTADTLLSKLGLGYEDLSAIEFNEAFAVIDVLFFLIHPSLRGIYNTFGGALAYGHPYGASGAILMLHLLKALSYAGGGKGILSIAGAGGMGEAIGVEML